MPNTQIHPRAQRSPGYGRKKKVPWLRRLHPSVLVLVMGSWIALSVAAWLVFGRQTGWRNWMTGFSFFKAGVTGVGRGEIRRAAGAADLSYLGDGRADLGRYSIRIFDPVTRTTLRTDFRLEGDTVCPDENAFQRFLDSHHRFFREQVMVTLRNFDPEDFVDSELELLEKKIVSRVNRGLGQRFLVSAEIRDFSMYESIEDSAFVERE